MTIVKTLAFWACILTASYCPAESQSTVPLQNVRWQTLPDAIRSVVVGPDQRVWYRLGDDEEQASPATFCAEIARQFLQPNPQIKGFEPVLFEPSGAVWFRSSSPSVLERYDGTNCLEHDFGTTYELMGSCSDHGSATPAVNFFAAGVAFFPDHMGVHTFDGTNWAYLALGNGPSAPIFRVEQDGRGVIGLLPDSDSPPWRWRAGRWVPIPLPTMTKDELLSITDFAPLGRDDETSLLLFGTNGATSLLHLEKTNPKIVNSLVGQLADPAYANREMATLDLIRKGATIRPQIEAILKENRDPEVQYRLQRVLKELEPLGNLGLTVAGYRLKKSRLLYYSTVGTLYLTSESIDDGDGETTDGLLILDNQGRARILRGLDVQSAWKATSTSSGPIFVQPDHQVWLTSNRDLLPRLLDLDRGTFTDTLPDRNHRAIAALTNGTVFASSQDSYNWEMHNVAVYLPLAPDTRDILPAIPMKLATGSRGICAVTPDGSIWAESNDQGLVRFDGKVWQRLALPPDVRGLKGLIPGRSNEVIALFQKQCYLFKEQKSVVQGATLTTLIQANREQIIEALHDVWSGNINWFGAAGIVVDRPGNIWILNGFRVQVLVGDHLLNATYLLHKAGSRIGQFQYFAPLNEGKRVYLADIFGFAGIGQVVNGELKVTAAPVSCELHSLYQAGRDFSGTVWVPFSERTEESNHSFVENGRSALRLTEDGIVAEIPHLGSAQLFDRSGNIWLGHNLKTSMAQYQVWNENAPPYPLTVPGGQGLTLFVSDQPGSVYAITSAGLSHFNVIRGGEPNRYQLHQLYTLQNMEGRPSRFYYSARGYLVVQTSLQHEDRSEEYNLYLVRIPEPPQK